MVNKVILIGNLGKDPEVRFTQSGSAVANFSIATSEQWNDRDGKRQERTEWHNIVVWGKQGELCGQYLAKGRQVYVEGSIRTRSYDDKDGKKVYATEVVADDVILLGSRGGDAPMPTDEFNQSPRSHQEPRQRPAAGGAGAAASAPAADKPFDAGITDDDVPF